MLSAWNSIGCTGTIRFTENNARIQLLNEYHLNMKLVLDASGLANGVTLVGATGKWLFYVVAGNLTATSVTFADTQKANFGNGGALYFDGTAGGTFERCTFRNNTAIRVDGNARGGAIYVGGGGTFVFRNCVFRDNTVTGGGTIDGGAIHAIEPAAKFTFINTIFINNRAMVSLPYTSHRHVLSILCHLCMIATWSFWPSSPDLTCGRVNARDLQAL